MARRGYFVSRVIAYVVATFVVLSCTDHYEDVVGSTPELSSEGRLRVVLDDATSRSYIADDMKIHWHADDRVAVFYGNKQCIECRFDGATGDSSGTISPVEVYNQSAEHIYNAIYAYYPYSSDVSLVSSNEIRVSFSKMQSYIDESFGRGANSMVAVSKSLDAESLSFRNIGGMLKLQLWGEGAVRSITIKGNNNEIVAGEATVKVAYDQLPTVEMAQGGEKSLTLDCGEGVNLNLSSNNATDFWIVLPPVTFTNGFTIDVESVDGSVYTKSTNKRVVIERNTIQPMQAVEVVFEVQEVLNELRYRTTDGAKLNLSSSDFSNTIVSHVMVDGEWVVTFSDDFTTIGDYAFEECRNIESISIPKSVKHIGKKAFSNSTIQILRVDAELISFGDEPFYRCSIDTLTVNCNLKGTTLDNGALYDLPLFYGSYIENLIFTPTVDSIGGYSFIDISTLRSVIIPYGVEVVGDGVFMWCTSLTEVVFPESVKLIGGLVLSGCSNLVSVTSLATTPPELGSDAFPKDTQVRVLDSAFSAYQSHVEWRKYILSNLAGEVYSSTDYTQDGKVEIYQKASEGNGIDVVFMGDGYSDRQIAAGYYRQHMEKAIGFFFSEEPYASFRHLFNIYVVTCVSRHEGYNMTGKVERATAMDVEFCDDGLIKGYDPYAFNYAIGAIGVDRLAEVLTVVVLNSDNYGGTCWMYSPNTYPYCEYGGGHAVAYLSQCGNEETFRKLLLHEAAGHGFAKLGDEYSYSQNGYILEGDYYWWKGMEEYGWYKNVDYTYNSTKDAYLTTETVKWRHLLQDERYANEGLGLFEGAMSYPKGVYRATDVSIMHHNEGGFNAPSRESIYQRIHALAYGSSWSYDYEAFVEYDSINRSK